MMVELVSILGGDYIAYPLVSVLQVLLSAYPSPLQRPKYHNWVSLRDLVKSAPVAGHK